MATPEPLALSIVIPFYNEEGNARSVVEGLAGVLAARGEPYEIVGVQNGSRDDTAAVLAQLAGEFPNLRVVTVETNRGFGFGVLEGLAAARGRLLGYMPGDGQIEPASVVRVLDAMRAHDAPIGQGRRISRGDGPLRWLVSRCYNLLVSLLFLRSMGDMNGHPKIFGADVYREMNLASQDHFLDAELMLKASVLGYEVCSVPVEFRKREAGRSAVRVSTCLEFFNHLLEVRFTRNDRWGIGDLRRAVRVRRRRPASNASVIDA